MTLRLVTAQVVDLHAYRVRRLFRGTHLAATPLRGRKQTCERSAFLPHRSVGVSPAPADHRGLPDIVA